MADLATTADVAARWRPLTAEETTVATALLTDASAVLRARVATLDERVASGDLPAALVVAVCSQMVLRVLRNRDGLVTEQIDDYGYRRADGAADGRLYVTRDELDLLTEAASSGVAFTIAPGYVPGWTSPDLDWS